MSQEMEGQLRAQMFAIIYASLERMNVGNRYTPQNILLGQGSYAITLAAKTGDGRDFALKVFFPHVLKEYYRGYLREVTIMSKLKHGNVMAIQDLLVDYSPESPNACIVMERMEMILHDAFNRPDLRLNMYHVKLFISQILCGLDYIHGNHYLHRDIKPENCLVSRRENYWELRVADFGLAREQCVMKTIGGVVTASYRSPELLLAVTRYTSSIDIWSAGCTLAFMLNNGRPLFHVEKANDMKIINKIIDILGTPNEVKQRTAWEEVNSNVLDMLFARKVSAKPLSEFLCTPDGQPVPQIYLDILRWMLCFDPSLRPLACDVLSLEVLEDCCPLSFYCAGECVESIEPQGDLTREESMQAFLELQRDNSWGHFL